MQLIVRWVLPIAFLAIGIAILTGLIFQQIPEHTYLRQVMGMVVILLGVHRFIVSRMVSKPAERRRFGGERKRPWEDDHHE
jgi:hypothetical protein